MKKCLQGTKKLALNGSPSHITPPLLDLLENIRFGCKKLTATCKQVYDITVLITIERF